MVERGGHRRAGDAEQHDRTHGNGLEYESEDSGEEDRKQVPRFFLNAGGHRRIPKQQGCEHGHYPACHSLPTAKFGAAHCFLQCLCTCLQETVGARGGVLDYNRLFHA